MKALRPIRIATLALAAVLGFLVMGGLGDLDTAGVGSPALAGSEKAAEHPDVEFDLSCKDCHAQETPEVFTAWNTSTHGDLNIGCFICHGDGSESFFNRPPVETCRGCHDQNFAAFSASGMESCFSCHNGHTLQFHQD